MFVLTYNQKPLNDISVLCTFWHTEMDSIY